MRSKYSLLYSGMAILFSTLLSSFSPVTDISINITGIRSGKGKIYLSVFKDQASFEEEIPFKRYAFDKKGLQDGSMAVKIDLPADVYGIALLDDENSNGKMEKNILGIPKEGFGFSNYYLTKMKKPELDEFKVDLRQGKPVVIKVKYM